LRHGGVLLVADRHLVGDRGAAAGAVVDQRELQVVDRRAAAQRALEHARHRVAVQEVVQLGHGAIARRKRSTVAQRRGVRAKRRQVAHSGHPWCWSRWRVTRG
jgi:hypothetical protein